MKKQLLITAIIAVLFGLLMSYVTHAQTIYVPPAPIVLTQKSKAVNMGTATANGEFTFSCTLQADSMCGYYVNSGIIFSEFGDNRIYFEYPNLYFVTQWDNHGTVKDTVNVYPLVDVICWSTLFNGKPHSFIVAKSPSKKEVYIDSVLIGSQGAPPQAGFTSPIWLSSDRVDYKFSGTITNFNYSPTYQAIRAKPMPAGTIDTLEYPAGYKPFSNDWSKTPDPVTQYAMFPTPPWDKKATNEYNFLIMNLQYMAGWPNLPNDVVAKNGKILATQLALKFRCGFPVARNLNALNSDVTKHDFSFDVAIMDTAKYYPDIPMDFGTACSQTDAIGSLIPYPLENVTATTPLSALKPTRDILYQQAVLFNQLITDRNIPKNKLRHSENREIMGWMGGGLTGTDIFNRNYNYMLDSARSLFPFLYTTGYDIYSMQFWNENGLKWPQVLAMTNTGRSTISEYMVYQKVWKEDKWGNIRGAEFRGKSLVAEIASGNPISTPYVSPGWSKNVEDNMQISNFSGMLGIYIVEGAAFLYPAYFTINESGVQDPKGYCPIPAICAYAQAPLSKPEYWDIIMHGTMVPGSSGVPGDYNIWGGKVTIMTVAKKLGTKYIIATTNQKENVYNYVTSRKLQIPLTFEGYYFPKECFFTRPQATYWYFDSEKKIEAGVNPKMIATSVQRGWPGYWKNANTSLLID